MAIETPIDDGTEIPGAGSDQDWGADATPAAAAPALAGEAPLTLDFADLLPDANGEIVVLGADLGTQLNIVTDQRICAEGTAEPHLTADGLDVAGLSYFAFEGGTTLYYSPDIAITVAPQHG